MQKIILTNYQEYIIFFSILINKNKEDEKVIKKLLAVSVSAVMMLAMSVSAFAAGSVNTSEQKILDELNAKNVPAKYVSQAKNYVEKDGVDITEAQAKEIIAHIDAADKILSDAGITVADLKKDRATLEKVVEEAKKAAQVLNLILTFNYTTYEVTVVDASGKTVAVINSTTTKTTGADSMSTVAVVSVLGLAVATLAVVTKKNAEA